LVIFIVSVVGSMASQNPEDWEFPLPEDLIQLFQPSISKRHLRDEEGPSERHVQLRLETDLQ
jgi:hypothetical protein